MLSLAKRICIVQLDFRTAENKLFSTTNDNNDVTAMTQLLLSADWLFFKLVHGSSREGFLVRKKVVLTLIAMSNDHNIINVTFRHI